ncbi:hypothetical protein CFP56_019619 [Quercus suber]|uniref:Uncharacterized protein n=1 Tax=Quercus suber TaxID=58331 RepID=A0AAW0KGQ2_QUESU
MEVIIVRDRTKIHRNIKPINKRDVKEIQVLKFVQCEFGKGVWGCTIALTLKKATHHSHRFDICHDQNHQNYTQFGPKCEPLLCQRSHQGAKTDESRSLPRSTLPLESKIPMLLQFFQAGFFLKLPDKIAARPICLLGSTTTFNTSYVLRQFWAFSRW